MEIEKEKISVIIPVYNVEKYLKRCLDSVINQTYKNLEVILVDDGSTDNSGKICDEYAEKDKRIIVIHKNNGGLSDARNKGLDICTGNYISFIDSDDWIEKNFYEFAIDNLDKADLLIFDYYLTTDKKKKFVKCLTKACYLTVEECLRELSKANIQSYAWNKLYKKELFAFIRFPKGINYEDQAIMHLIVDKCSKIKYFNKAFYNYFQNQKSITHTINYKNYKDFFYVNILRGRFLKKKYTEIYEYHLNYIYSSISKLCWYYQSEKRYQLRYKLLQKVILKKLKDNVLNRKIRMKTKIKMFLCVSKFNVIKLLYR